MSLIIFWHFRIGIWSNLPFLPLFFQLVHIKGQGQYTLSWISFLPGTSFLAADTSLKLQHNGNIVIITKNAFQVQKLNISTSNCHSRFAILSIAGSFAKFINNTDLSMNLIF